MMITDNTFLTAEDTIDPRELLVKRSTVEVEYLDEENDKKTAVVDRCHLAFASTYDYEVYLPDMAIKDCFANAYENYEKGINPKISVPEDKEPYIRYGNGSCWQMLHIPGNGDIQKVEDILFDPKLFPKHKHKVVSLKFTNVKSEMEREKETLVDSLKKTYGGWRNGLEWLYDVICGHLSPVDPFNREAVVVRKEVGEHLRRVCFHRACSYMTPEQAKFFGSQGCPSIPDLSELCEVLSKIIAEVVKDYPLIQLD